MMARGTLGSALLAVGLATVLTCLPAAAAADGIRFMRDPHAAHGLIAFSYQGDIWIVRADGSGPRRLTSHVARDVVPRFSPDGRRVAFTSDRMGNDDVWVVSVDGGEPTQLTFHTAGDEVQYWTPDGSGIVFTTSRGRDPWGTPLYVVPAEGGLPLPMGMDRAGAGMVSQDGRLVAFNRDGFSGTRKGYKGNRTTDVFVQALPDGPIRQLTDTDIARFREFRHDALPMWGADGMIYFVSERDDVFNIWRIAPDGGEPRQVTRHERGGVLHPSISPDGRTIAYTSDHELWVLDLTGEGAEPRHVEVELAFDPTDNLVEYVDVRDEADGFAPSPDGSYVAVDQRGEVVIVPSEEGVGEMRRVTESAWRDRRQSWSPDRERIAWVSDASGEEEIWIFELADGSRRQLTSYPAFKGDFVWSPDGARLAWEAANRLFETDVAGGGTVELGHNEAGGFSISGYSADGRWLVYDRRDREMDSEVYLFEIQSRRELNVTENPFRDGRGELTPDGRTLLFLSSRDDGTQHLFALPLTRLTEDPDDPLVRERRRAATGERESGDAEPGPVTVETDGIERRARQLTTGEGVGSYFLSADGTTAYFTSSDDEGPGLFSVPVRGGERTKVTAGQFGRLTPTADRKTVFYAQGRGGGSQIHRMPLASKRKEQVSFAFSVRVDERAEWRQIFEESWRVMRDRFYDEDMHGRDWEAIRAEYRPLLPHVGTYEDVYDLANLMIGELNASHVGVRGPPSRSMPDAYRTRFLGLELEPADGRYRISHVYRDGPADEEWLDLEVGDYVLAIDGTEVREGDNYWRILNHTLNEYVPVLVADTPGGAGREVRIRTVTSLRDIQYEEWVAENRAFVDSVSGGRIAYVHIRSMNQPSLARFENEIDRYWQAQGIVVDIRYNGGGNIDQQLIDILERRPYQFWNNRWGAPTWGRRPRQAIAGPKVMLINHRSGSDSEVTPMGFRDLGLGRIVGNPTAAAVIATGSYGLINGGSIRTPGSLVVTWDPEKPNNFGINLENYGVAPDVMVVNTPADELNGFDRELKAAVDEALKMLREGRWQYVADEDRGGRGGGD